MTGFQFDDEGMKAFLKKLRKQFSGAEVGNPIPLGASVEEIETILINQLAEAGATADQETIHKAAVEIFDEAPDL